MSIYFTGVHYFISFFCDVFVRDVPWRQQEQFQCSREYDEFVSNLILTAELAADLGIMKGVVVAKGWLVGWLGGWGAFSHRDGTNRRTRSTLSSEIICEYCSDATIPCRPFIFVREPESQLSDKLIDVEIHSSRDVPSTSATVLQTYLYIYLVFYSRRGLTTILTAGISMSSASPATIPHCFQFPRQNQLTTRKNI